MSASHVQEQWLPVPVRLVEAVHEAPNLRSRLWAVAYLVVWVLFFHRTRLGKANSIRDLGERATCSNHDRIRAAMRDAAAFGVLWEQPRKTDEEPLKEEEPRQEPLRPAIQQGSGDRSSRTVFAQPPPNSRTPAAHNNLDGLALVEEVSQPSRTPVAHPPPDRARLPLQPTTTSPTGSPPSPPPTGAPPGGDLQPAAVLVARDRGPEHPEPQVLDDRPAPPRTSALVLSEKNTASKKTSANAVVERPAAWALPVASELPAWLSNPLEQAGYRTLGDVCGQTRGQLARERLWPQGRIQRHLDDLEDALSERGLALLTTEALLIRMHERVAARPAFVPLSPYRGGSPPLDEDDPFDRWTGKSLGLDAQYAHLPRFKGAAHGQ